MEFFTSLLSALPGAVAQGLIWGLMAIGVYITYKVLDLADLTVDGTMATGGAVCIILMTNGVNVWVAMLCAFLAGMLAGLVTGVLHTFMGIPAILAGILTQLALYSINLRIMDGKANTAINPNNFDLLVSLRNVRSLTLENPIFVAALFTIVIIAVLYWFFGTSLGCSIRATGANPNMSRAQGVPGLRRRQRRPRRHRHRPGCRHHRRGALQPHLPQLRPEAAVGGPGRGDLLCGHPDRPHRRSEHQ